MEGIFCEIRPMIAKRLRKDESQIRLESNFRLDLGADSIDLVELVMSLENHYNVEFDDDRVEAIATVAEAVSYVQQLLAAQA